MCGILKTVIACNGTQGHKVYFQYYKLCSIDSWFSKTEAHVNPHSEK